MLGLIVPGHPQPRIHRQQSQPPERCLKRPRAPDLPRLPIRPQIVDTSRVSLATPPGCPPPNHSYRSSSPPSSASDPLALSGGRPGRSSSLQPPPSSPPPPCQSLRRPCPPNHPRHPPAALRPYPLTERAGAFPKRDSRVSVALPLSTKPRPELLRRLATTGIQPLPTSQAPRAQAWPAHAR